MVFMIHNNKYQKGKFFYKILLIMRRLFNLNQHFLRNQLKQENYSDFKEYLTPKLNMNNILKWSNRKFMKYVNEKNLNNYIAYIFELFNSWLKLNERFTKSFLMDLDIVISKLDLRKFFYQIEINYIEYLFNIVFAKTRVLKDIVVDFETDRFEKVYFNYEVLYLSQESNGIKIPDIFNDSNIFLTTDRIVLSNKFEYISINLNEVYHVILNSDYIKIVTLNKVFDIYSFDAYLIYISLERIGKLTDRYL